MKTFQINLQTTLFLTELSVLGAYNENKKILVYNKPLMVGDTLEKMIEALKEQGKEVESTYQTDSFGVNFYDNNQGVSGVQFHEVEGTPVN